MRARACRVRWDSAKKLALAQSLEEEKAWAVRASEERWFQTEKRASARAPRRDLLTGLRKAQRSVWPEPNESGGA